MASMAFPAGSKRRRLERFGVQLTLPLQSGLRLRAKALAQTLADIDAAAASSSMLTWEVKIGNDRAGARWAIVTVVVAANGPGEAAGLAEAWLAEATAVIIPQQRSESGMITAQVLA